MKIKTFLSILILAGVSYTAVMAEASHKKVIAHRGLSGTYPENTMISFKRALETSAELMELDVHLSKDDIPMVIHDRKLNRTTSGTGFVDARTTTQLKTLSAGYSKKFQYKFYKEKIPTLTEVLDLIDGKKITLFIEIKSHTYKEDPKDKVTEPDKEYDLRVGPLIYKTVMNKHAHVKNQVVFISFAAPILEEIRKLDPAARLAPIFHELPEQGSLADQAIALKTDIVIFNKELLDQPNVFEKTDRIHHFVYTVKPDEFKKMNGVPLLTGYATDYADLALHE